jgi:sugar phosphate isomerase/epimerase
MNRIQGPGIFLAQFLRDSEPFNNIESISAWVASLGYKGIQVPTWDTRVFDLAQAAGSKDYCDEYKGKRREAGLEVIELAAYLQGQVLAMHPAYELLFQSFYPKGLADRQRTDWATEQLRSAVTASGHFGTTNISVLSGGLAWPYLYPWPQRSNGLVEEAFDELAKRWRPILDFAHEHGVTFGFELHPGSDLFDGTTFLRFLDKTDDHPAACITYDASHFLLQQLDYLDFIKIFSDRIKAFHVKDAEFNPTGLGGVYGGNNDWKHRAGRFRTLGDGQVDFTAVFSKLAEYGYASWAVLDETRRALVERLLMNKRLTITEISQSLGYAAPSGLSRWFRDSYGCSPTSWTSSQQR